MAIAASWAAVATTVAFEMAMPALVGLGLDRWLGTEPALIVVGAILGLILGMFHLVKLTKAKPLNGDPVKKQGR